MCRKEDERTIANKLERESKREQEKEEEKSFETLQLKKDATLPVCSGVQDFVHCGAFADTALGEISRKRALERC